MPDVLPTQIEDGRSNQQQQKAHCGAAFSEAAPRVIAFSAHWDAHDKMTLEGSRFVGGAISGQLCGTQDIFQKCPSSSTFHFVATPTRLNQPAPLVFPV